jgi:hypothetical protein
MPKYSKYQEAIFDYGINILDKEQNLLIDAKAGTGKAQPLTAKVLTPKGYVPMGSLSIGDEVIAVDGSITTIVGIYPQGKKKVLRFIFQDGSSAECCEEHLWLTTTHHDRWTKGEGTLKTAKEVADSVFYRKTRREHHIPVASPPLFPAVKLNLNPYLLGALIGDGGFTTRGIVFSTADEFMVAQFKRLVPQTIQVKHRSDYDYGLSSTVRGNVITKELKRIGLMGLKSFEKFIPEEYLISSISQRTALLQGLMDTDGTVSNSGKNITFSTTSAKLAEGITFLVQSLGGTCTVTTRTTSFTYLGEKKEGRLSYRCTLCLPNSLNPFKLPRKREKVIPRVKYFPRRILVKVEESSEKECQCIAVAHKEHLYITDNMIVTHNTFTSIELVKRFYDKYPNKRVLMTAFNKKNAVELQDRLKEKGIPFKSAQAKTLNSVGLATVKKNCKGKINVDPSKGKLIAKELAKQWNKAVGKDREIAGLNRKVARLAELAKATLNSTTYEYGLRNLCWEHLISCDNEEIGVICQLAAQAMDFSAADPNNVDFTDMIWFPYRFKQYPWQYDLVIVDEAQDQNAAMLSLARKSMKRNGRIIIVGDPRQAIYGWRGADSEFMERACEELNAVTLTLPVTYRCAKNIVKEVEEIVPTFEAHKDNPDGIVREASIGTMLKDVEEGDFIISRVNADLMQYCISLLKDGKRAIIQGRDIMGMLINIIARSEKESVVDFLDWLSTYRTEEAAKLVLLEAEERQIDDHYDRCECLKVLAVECKTTQCLIDKLQDLFSDDGDDESKIVLTTAHRSKGLERERVWLLRDTFRPDTGIQEENCLYVAITRAKNELVYVT